MDRSGEKPYYLHYKESKIKMQHFFENYENSPGFLFGNRAFDYSLTC
jgi:hypothetical protein